MVRLCTDTNSFYVQWAFYFVFWTGLLVLFQSQTAPAARRTSLEVSEPILLTAMDDLFRPHTIAKQTLLNTLGVGSILVFSCILVLTSSGKPPSQAQSKRFIGVFPHTTTHNH